MKFCAEYKVLLDKVLSDGVARPDPNRKGVQRLQIPKYLMTLDMRDGFPMLTTKKMWWKGIVVETLWMLRGESNIKYLVDNGLGIWNKDTYNYLKRGGYRGSYEDWISLCKQRDYVGVGSIGRMYGVQWRNYEGDTGYDDHIDQLSEKIQEIIDSPYSSNITIFGDNPADREFQALPCCMYFMQFTCEPMASSGFETISGDFIDLHIHYRSHDVVLGYPWNVAQYALILHIVAQITGKTPRYLFIESACVHLYDNQLEAAREQLTRNYTEYPLPKVILPESLSLPLIDDFSVDWGDFKLDGYKSYPKLENQPEMLSYED